MTISLNKRAEKIGIILAKHSIFKIPAIRVGGALDVSGSTRGLYGSGVMQETVDRLLAVSLKFDDNGELDMWSFDTNYSQLSTATPKDYGSFIKEKLLTESGSLWGGTVYAGVLNDMVDFWFRGRHVTRKKKALFGLVDTEETVHEAVDPALAALPAMGLLITDGANSDKSDTERVLTESQGHNVYWQMVGVGEASTFTFLQKMADKLPNVGFVNLESLSISDDEIYNQLIGEEFVSWVKTLNTN